MMKPGADNESRNHETLVDSLRENVNEHPGHVFVSWVDDSCNVVSELTHQQLWDQSELVADLLVRNGVNRGDRVMIAYKFGLDFLAALVGCMKLGVIACSVYPPNLIDKAKTKHSLLQFHNQVNNAKASFALTTSDFRLGLKIAGQGWGGSKTNLKWLSTDKLTKRSALKQQSSQQPQPVALSGDDVAFIQYSSGSTGDPKGVVITHKALLYNLKRLMAASKMNENAVGVCWMPQYHDYALIACFLMSFVLPASLYACSPISFIRNPLLWADMIDKFHPTHIGGPNFAYSLLAKRMKGAGRRLSGRSLVCASIGGEPIAPKTLEDIQDIGIPFQVISPSYGMAELCLLVSNAVGDEIRIHDGAVSVGYLARESDRGITRIRVADDSGRILQDGEVGEIFVQSPDLSQGYWNREDLHQRFHIGLSDGQEYFETGDLGKIVDGRLFVVGRKKELIIINGKNYYPTDLERTIESEFPDIIRPGSTVAFQNSDSNIGLVVEIRKTVAHQTVSNTLNPSTLQKLVANAHGVELDLLFLLKQGTVPKTTSGKLRRVECRRRCLEGEWKSQDIVRRWMQATQQTTKYQSESRELSKGDSEGLQHTNGIDGVFRSVIGASADLNQPWAELGLSSLQATELSWQVEEKLLVKLPLNFVEAYRTPLDLKRYIETQSCHNQPFVVQLPELETVDDTTHELSPCWMMLIQGFCILLVLFVLATAFLTTFFVGKASTDLIPAASFEVGSSQRRVTWMWLPLTIPTFFISFSILVVVLKWVVIGRYRQNVVIEIPSTMYLRWWFVDRLMDLWELLVGQFLLDTKFIWLVYRLLGARLDWSVTVDGFMREFDLASVGGRTSLQHQIRCRKFLPWGGTKSGKPGLKFRPIVIGKNCSIQGMVSPGANVGDGTKVEKLSAVVEGAQIPSGSLARGSPAYNAGTVDSSKKASVKAEVYLDLFKVLWLIHELYHFFGLFLVAQIILNERLPPNWRYSPLLYWCLIVLLTNCFGIVTSILLKWLLLGRKRTTNGKGPSLGRRMAKFACDYHYRVSTTALTAVSGPSKLWNLILMLHGLDIDFASLTSAGWRSLCPSKVDFVKIRRSFVPSVSFDIDESKGMIEIVDSNLGYEVRISSGVQVSRSIIAPRAVVTESVYDSGQVQSFGSNYKRIGLQLVIELLQLAVDVLLFLSLIPAYEIFISLAYDTSIWVAMVGVVASVGAYAGALTLLASLMEVIELASPVAIQASVFAVYLSHLRQSRPWSLSFLLYGTPFMKYWLRLMGARVNGEIWYFGTKVYDLRKLQFSDKTIVDDAHFNAHTLVFWELMWRDVQVSGLVHPGCYVSAGAVVEGVENGPWKVFLGSQGEKASTMTGENACVASPACSSHLVDGV